eukprot:Em0002g1404a
MQEAKSRDERYSAMESGRETLEEVKLKLKEAEAKVNEYRLAIDSKEKSYRKMIEISRKSAGGKSLDWMVEVISRGPSQNGTQEESEVILWSVVGEYYRKRRTMEQGSDQSQLGRLQMEKRDLEEKCSGVTMQLETARKTILQLDEATRRQAASGGEMEELKRNVSELKSRNGDLMSTINDLNRKNADLKNRNVDLERQLEQTRDDRNKRDLRDKLALYENQVHTISFLEGLDQRLEIGRGSFGAVYKVKLNGLPCIAKGLHEILLGLGGNYQVAETDIQAIRQKFLNECVLLSKLKHPNIVQFLGVHSTKINEYLVMEYMHMDLAECLKTYPDIPASIKVSILHDVSYGLLHLHSQDPPIIHRDLTATNILLTQDMRAKIADLGVSKIFDIQQLHSASVQTIAPGTKAYMPPEALIPDPKYGFKLDIFSFGVLSLYTAIQEFPIEHEHQITAAVAEKQEVQIYRRKHWIEKMGMDHPLRPLVIKCLQDRPELRPTTKDVSRRMDCILTQQKKEWNNVLELYSQFQVLKRESDNYRKQLGYPIVIR